MKKTIVIFSNPFGYGPTGKAIAIANEFLKSDYLDIVFAGSSFVQEIIPSSITTINIDERNEQAIQALLKTIPHPVVISSQNRFAIKAAKSLDVPCAFLDGLSWFWKEIPPDHFIADEIFWMRYPGFEEKVTRSPHSINLVSAIIDIRPASSVRNQILIHLGGCKNPLVEAFPKQYLDILSNALSAVSSHYVIKVVGGVDAIDYLKAKLSPATKNKVIPVTLKHDEFIEELNRSLHFITTAGQTATLEAFALGVPTSFLLPMNLSQLALTDLLSHYEANPQYLRWDKYGSIKMNDIPLNEKDALVAFNTYAEVIGNSEEAYQSLNHDIVQLIERVPEVGGQKKFIDNLGTDGAKMIKEILSKKWNLL